MKNPIRGIPLVILLTALLATSCGAVRKSANAAMFSTRQQSRSEQVEAEAAARRDTTRQTREQTQTDSAFTRRVYAEPIPAELTQLMIPARQLLDLPDGALYAARSGRVSVEARRQGDTILIRSRCDSIARRCISFERRVARQHTRIDSLTARIDAMRASTARADSLSASEALTLRTSEHTRKPPAAWPWWLLTGFLAGGAASALLTKTNPLKTIVSFIQKII